MIAQEYLWAGIENVGWQARTFTAGVDRVYIVCLDAENPRFNVVLVDTSGDVPVVLDDVQMSGQPNVAAFNNHGNLSMFYAWGSNRPGWTVTHSGSTLSITEWTLDDTVQPADFGNQLGIWRHYDVTTLSPNGAEMFVGGINTVDVGGLFTRIGQLWSVDTMTGGVNWFIEYSLPDNVGLLGPCVGSPNGGQAIANYVYWPSDDANIVTHFLLLTQDGVVDTLTMEPGLPYQNLIGRQYWCETGGSLTYATYSQFNNLLHINTLQAGDALALSWLRTEFEQALSNWTDYGDDPFWDLARDAWGGQMVLFPLRTGFPSDPLWYDVPTGDWVMGTGPASDPLYTLQVHATGKATTVRANIQTWDMSNPVILEKWGMPIPPAPLGIFPLRMSRRNDSYGFTEPHARFQQNLNASSASTTGQRIYGLGKNASDPPDPQ